MKLLPKVMVAPNGARRGRKDHPNIPITDDQLIETAQACFEAGADGLHAHVRDDDGLHLLDAGRYRALLDRLSEDVPGMFLQVTSEAGGRYEAAVQQQVVRDLRPENVSVALREMVRQDGDWGAACAFYDWAAGEGVTIQHILYSLGELDRFIEACSSGGIPGDHHLIQLVLGTYDGTEISRPEMVADYVARMGASDQTYDWMMCAFGPEETVCLAEVARLGGKVRVGFENSLWNADGSVAQDNAERVREVRGTIAAVAG
ncbi:3-keto-5-aminohexanoate cleavage protein [Rhodobacteraceae bacterium]|nr:3-keto-5-aminohexanoate cleavage protein [Paracoccaceae bacterium]